MVMVKRNLASTQSNQASGFINYEPILESLFDQFKLYLIVCPLLLLLLVHWFSNNERGWLSYLFPLSAETDRAGTGRGTPWGVGFVLVLLLFFISYQSNFQERWFGRHHTKYDVGTKDPHRLSNQIPWALCVTVGGLYFLLA
ncbi:hypothetical protein QYF36_004260 [Acer negundo]|nr:hypothetical protein QYF36_004260 [Acer negundo]